MMSAKANKANNGNRRYAFVAYDFGERISGSSARAIGFARNSSAFGWSPEVITASPLDEHPQLDDCSISYVPSPERSFSGGIHQSSDDGTLRPPRGLLKLAAPLKALVPLERQLTWVPNFKRALASVPLEHVDAVVTTVAPYASLVPGCWLADRLRVPHVVDLRDDWQDRFRIEKRTWLNRKLLSTYMERTLRRAAAVLVVSPVTQERLNRLGINTHLVYNGYHEEDFDQVALTPQFVSTAGELKVLHAGWLGSFRSMQSVFDAMEAVVIEMNGEEGFSFTQMGLVDLESQASLTKTYTGLSIRHVQQQPREVAIAEMLQSDVLIVVPGTNIPAAISGKLFDYLRSRRPILMVAGEGAARDLGNKVGLRYMCSPDDSESIKSVLRRLLEDKRLGKLMTGSTAENIADFSRSESARQLAGILDNVVEHHVVEHHAVERQSKRRT